MIMPPKIAGFAPGEGQYCAAHAAMFRCAMSICGHKDAQDNDRLTEAPGKLAASTQRLVGPFPPHSGRPRSFTRSSGPSSWSQPGCRLPQLRESAAKVPRRYRRLTGRGA